MGVARLLLCGAEDFENFEKSSFAHCDNWIILVYVSKNLVNQSILDLVGVRNTWPNLSPLF